MCAVHYVLDRGVQEARNKQEQPHTTEQLFSSAQDGYYKGDYVDLSSFHQGRSPYSRKYPGQLLG